MRIGRPQGPGRLQGGPGPALSPSVLCLNRLFSPRSLLSLVQGFSPWSPLPAVLLFPGVSLSCCISEIFFSLMIILYFPLSQIHRMGII